VVIQVKLAMMHFALPLQLVLSAKMMSHFTAAITLDE